MNVSKFLSAAALAMAVVAAPVAKATVTVKVLGAGSSAMWQTAATGAWNQLAGGGAGGALHFTVKGSCSVGNCAQIADSRGSYTGQTILPEGGNLWVVWNAAQTEVWAYISVDSVVGNRAYFATPRTTLQLDPGIEQGSTYVIPSSQTNLVSNILWGNDVTQLPTAIYTALNGASITTAFTDIRPEDAKFASCRVLNQLNTSTYAGLGYGTGTTCTTTVGTQIFSDFSSTVANPVNFNIKGTDPFSHQTIPQYTTVDVGASPITVVVNRTNLNGLGYGLTSTGGGVPTITNIDVPTLQTLWQGQQCDTNEFLTSANDTPPPVDVPVHVMQREPLSGTYNTFEFTNVRCGQTQGTSSPGPCSSTPPTVRYATQEFGVNPANANNNPLNLACTTGGGTRQRAIGTGEMVGTAVHNTTDSIGYTFWGFGNVSKIAGTASYGYLTLEGIDPIQTTYTNGILPICDSVGNGVCPAAPGASFPNLRNGTYRSWSVLRVVTNASGVNLENTKSLVIAIQNNVNTTTPDFVPFVPVGADPGLLYYRSHYAQSSVAANNGLSGQREAGGDVGGCIEPVGPAPGTLNCHQ
jgi:hypothetical protein